VAPFKIADDDDVLEQLDSLLMKMQLARRSFRFLQSQLCIAALVVALQAGVTWKAEAQWKQLTNGTPSARFYGAMAEDAARNRIVLFGGSPDGNGAITDPWCWRSDLAYWQPLTSPGPQPPARFVHAMAPWSNGTNSHLVMFGGQGTNGTFLRDTWTFNGTNWQAGPSNGPTARVLVAMAEETARQRVLLFGGFDGSLMGDTWEWNGVAWTQLAVSGPSGRAGHAMAYDALRNKVVLFGGQDSTGYRSDIWEFGSDLIWRQVGVGITNGPVARRDASMARRGNRIVLYGGVNTSDIELADTWEWDGTNWIQTVVGAPSARFGASMVSDTFNAATLLFGGANSTNANAGTWRYSGPIIKSQPASTAANAGQPASFSIQVASGGATAVLHWERNCGGGFQSISNATNATYTIASVTTNDACVYRCVVQLGSATATSQAAQLSVRGPCTPVSYNVTIAAGLSLIANQVDTGGNTLNEVFPLGPNGAAIYKWDPVACSYVSSFFDSINQVWVPNLTLNPGEGAFFYNPGAAFVHNYAGCAHTPALIPAPTNCCILVARQTNGVGNWDNIISTPPSGGARVYRYGNGGFTVYTFDEVDLVWTPSFPIVAVGESMWICCPNCTVTLLPPCVEPSITTQPASQVVQVGCCFTFTVGAVGSPTLSYQWQFNGVNIAGATASSYTKCPATLADAGSYSVNVSNPCGGTKSLPANLTVTSTPPVLNCPTNDIVVQASPPGTNVYYNVTATAGCDTNVTIDCTPPSGSVFPCGTNLVTCTAHDSTGNQTTCAFNVVVLCSGCMAITQEQIQPVAGTPGQYTYTFNFQNLSGVPVKYLFLVPTGCQSVSPDIFNFTPPLASGNATNLSALITLPAGCTNLCFTVSAHTTNLTQCCSVVHCIPAVKPPPVLGIDLAYPYAILRWPDLYPEYHLESTISLRPPTIWAPVPGQPVFSNSTIYVTVPITNATRFFRLRTP
jgi:hypothetical protein